MQSITEKMFTNIYDRRDQDLSEDEIEVAVWWADYKILDMKRKWSAMREKMEESSPKSLGSSFAEFMSRNINPEVLEMIFWGKNLSNCCVRHAGSRPIAIDTNESTPAIDSYYKCSKSYRHDLRDLRRAYQLQAWNINGF